MDITEDIVRHYRWLRQYGVNDSHSGNLSARTTEGVWITPTGACADLLTAKDLVLCSLDGQPNKGASLDAPLHLAAYRQNRAANAVIHSHGPYTVALTLDGKDFTPPDFEGQLYFPHVPVITIDYQHYVEESPQKVAAILNEFAIMVVRGHGVYCRAQSLNLAYKWTCSLEHSAKTAYLARQLGII
jgi:L-fuculose-phosphate aldolase